MNGDRLLDAEEVAAMLGVPVTWVRETTRRGAMPVVRLGRYCRYDRAAVHRWLTDCSCPGEPTAFRKVAPRWREP